VRLFSKEIKKRKFILPQKILFEKDIKNLLRKYSFNVEEMILQEVIIKAGVSKSPVIIIKYIPFSLIGRRVNNVR